MRPLRIRLYVPVLILLAVGLTGLWFARSALIHQHQDEARLLLSGQAHHITEHVEQRLAGASAVLAGIERLLDPSHPTGQTLEDVCDLAMTDAASRSFQRLVVFDSGGYVRCATFPLAAESGPVADEAAANVRERDYFRRAMETGAQQFDGPFTGALTGREIFVLARPVLADAVAVAVFDAAELFVFDAAFPQGARVLIVDRHDQVAWVPGAGDPAAPPSLPPAALDHVRRGRLLSGDCGALDAGGWVFVCSRIGDTAHMVVVQVGEERLYAASGGASATWWLGMAGFVTVAVGALAFIDLGVVRRLLRLHRRAGLPALSMLDFPSHDEVDDLIEWAGGLASRNRALTERIEALTDERAGAERELLIVLAQVVETRYHELRDHGDRVALYVRAVAERLGLSREDTDTVAFTAQIHDLGKLVVPDAVYLKPGPLDPIEQSQMQLHAARGGEIVARMHALPPEVAHTVRHHHERWDGGGYPDGLRGDAIPIFARIISVADSYDAMTEHRLYRPALTHDEAIAILREGAGRQWDATIVGAFLTVLDEGTLAPKEAPAVPERASAS